MLYWLIFSLNSSNSVFELDWEVIILMNNVYYVGIRGRINFTKSIKLHAFDRGQVFCEFEQYIVNEPKNQIIRSTLHHLMKTGQFGVDRIQAEELRHVIRWIVRTLDGIDLIDLKPDFIHRQQVGRLDHDYRIMLTICDLLLQRRLPTEEAGQSYITQLERDRLILHHLFERFIANFYRFHLRQWEVSPQKIIKWHDKTSNPYMPIMQPDLFLENGLTGCTIVLDTKYTAHSIIENQWGKKLFDSSHLYQIYAYLKTQEHISNQHEQTIGILLYPAIKEELSEKIGLQKHQIRIECIDLSAQWIDIEERLLNIIIDCSM